MTLLKENILLLFEKDVEDNALLNKVEQKRFDVALIAMPLCLASSAYHGNPFYKDFESLKGWGVGQVDLYKRKDLKECLITNNEDYRRVLGWIECLKKM